MNPTCNKSYLEE